MIDDCSEPLVPLLQAGAEVFIIAGPVGRSGYDWYRVEPIGRRLESQGGAWIARASREGQPWLTAATAPACPTIKPSPSSLDRLSVGTILACLGRRELRFTADVLSCRCDVDYGPWRITGFVADLQPNHLVYLIDPDHSGDIHSDSLQLNLAAGAGSPEELVQLSAANVVGHFDDPASASCAWSESDEGVPVEDPILTCRRAFVVTHATP